MAKAICLLVLAAWLLGGCAETATSQRRSNMIHKASTCATCGALHEGYFSYTTDKAMGPGEWGGW